MKNAFLAVFLFSTLLAGCSSLSDAKTKSTATLQIFHSNDINGYLTECG